MKKIIRKLLSFFYQEGNAYPILFGPLMGKRMVFRKDVNYMEMMGLWERDSLTLLNKVFQLPFFSDKPVCVADVGANLGFYTIYFSTRLQPGSTVFAFEPSETVLALLKKNIAINHLQNVSIVEAACSDKTGSQVFYSGKNHHQDTLQRASGGRLSSFFRLFQPG